MSIFQCYSDWGTIRCVPTITNNESSISFFKNSDLSINSTGDVWIIGRSLYNQNANMFSIACNNVGNCLSIDTTGTTTINNNLNISGTINSTQITNINNNITSLSSTTTSLTNQLNNLTTTINNQFSTLTKNSIFQL